MSWQQTADLRFIERRNLPHEPVSFILQQRYVWRPSADIYIEKPESEWRDVPLVTAETEVKP